MEMLEMCYQIHRRLMEVLPDGGVELATTKGKNMVATFTWTWTGPNDEICRCREFYSGQGLEDMKVGPHFVADQLFNDWQHERMEYGLTS